MEIIMLPTRLIRCAMALFALLAFVLPAAADDITFSGEVTYRERIALPAGVELRITLVALPGAIPVAGATADTVGRASAPLQFALDVRSNVIRPDRDYGLVAEIRSEGRTLFRSQQPVPVDPAAPTHTVILVTLSPDPPHQQKETILPPVETPNPLLETIWTVTSIGGEPILPGSKVTFSIAADYRAGGNSGCNNYFTEAGFTEPPLAFGPIAGTRMACAPDIMAQETRFFAALGATVGYELSGNSLKLVDAAGVPLVGLVRQD
jgi:putative lipoprotein